VTLKQPDTVGERTRIIRRAEGRIAKPGCPSFTGWLDEGITYCDREIGPDGTHEGMHFYHVVHHKEIEEMKTLEERMKAAIKGLEDGLVDLKAIVAEAEAEIKAEEARREKGGEKHKGALSEDMKTALKTKGIGHPEIDKNEPLLVKDITIEMVRERRRSTAEIFGMEKLLCAEREARRRRRSSRGSIRRCSASSSAR
jgi:hypothetical protein